MGNWALINERIHGEEIVVGLWWDDGLLDFRLNVW